MVQIRTESIKSNKVSLVDLNKNVKELTETLREFNKRVGNSTSSAPSSSISNKTKKSSFSSSSSSNKKNEESAIKEFLKTIYSGEVKKQSNNVFDTLIGGFTGISPAIIQRLNITQALGSAIKKQWNNAKARAASSKVNSAIDENRKAGTNKRLDTIIGILKGSKKKQNADDKKQEGKFGQFLRTLGLFLGPLLKIAAGAALLGSIARAVNWIANHLGFDLSNKDTQKTVANTLATSAAAGKAGGLAATAKRGAMIDYMNKQADRLAKWNKSTKKLSPAEKAKALSSENEARKLGKQKGLSPEELDELLKNRKNLVETNAEIREKFTPKEQARIGKVSNLHGTRPYNWVERNLVPKNKAGLPINRSPFLQQGLNTFDKGLGKAIGIVDKPLYYGAHVLNAWNTGVELLNAQDESERAEAAVAGIINAIRVWGLRRAGGAVGSAVGGAVGSVVPGAGTAAGVAAGIGFGALLDYLIGRPLEKTARGLTRMYYGKPFSPSKTENTGFDITAPVQQQIANNGFSLNPDTNYNGFDLTTPEKAANDFINNFEKSPTNKQLESLTGLNNWADNLLFANDYAHNVKVNPNVYGLTTDFNKPIQAADQAEKPTTELVENTKSTNEILQDILAAIQDTNNSNKGLFSSISNKLNTPQQSPAMPQGASEGLDGLPSLSYLTNHGRIMNYEF